MIFLINLILYFVNLTERIMVMEGELRQIQRYVTAEGKIPFSDWFNNLKDIQAKLKITKRIARVELGNLGDCKSVGDGVFELRINYGPGYRIYFGQIDLVIILLLCGGDKQTQAQDIQKAKGYWQDYKWSNNHA
jgi:putative addiction module killer protein